MTKSQLSQIFNTESYKRKQSSAVNVGEIALGESNPIRLQTMTTTNTNLVTQTVEQCIRVIEAGSHYVRITTQGVREAQSLGLIKNELRLRGYNTPIIADIHFNPLAALEAAKFANKIRINPGNFTDKSRTSAFNFSQSEYDEDLKVAEQRFLDLLNICKQNNVAIRIGVNHGSLAQRIMSRYGDTPLGMANSAMEFVRICAKHNYHQLVVSMKSSNTRIMVQATRLMVKLMADEGMSYPLHLGVTEAGEGEDGRIKSAVGIGALLIDGIGDTIRVSLTEVPENEIPVAREMVNIFENWENQPSSITPNILPINPFDYTRRVTNNTLNIGGDNPPVVVADFSEKNSITAQDFNPWGWTYNQFSEVWTSNENAADYFVVGNNNVTNIPNPLQLPLIGSNPICKYALADISILHNSSQYFSKNPFFIAINVDEVDSELLEKIGNISNAILLLRAKNQYQFYNLRNLLSSFIINKIMMPAIVCINLSNVTIKNFQVIASAILGPLFLDGFGDGVMISAPNAIDDKTICSTTFGILQASRVRISKTEFISCPGCGRTLFNLNKTLQQVKARTAHLKGLKIGVMGCIVNGPGEMADADYGYVGSGQGRVSLYKKKNVIKKNIREDIAVDELIDLIKINGDWRDA